MRAAPLAFLLLAGCLMDFQEERRKEDPFERDPALRFRIAIDRLQFPAADPEVLHLFESLRHARAGLAGGSAWASNGMAAWSLGRDWPDRVKAAAASHVSWVCQPSTTLVREGEASRIILIEAVDPARPGRIRFFAGGVETEQRELPSRQTCFQAVVSRKGPLIDVEIAPVVIGRDGGETPLTALASRFSMEPGRFQLFTAHGQHPESAGAFLFVNAPGPGSCQVAVAIAVEVDEPAQVK